MSSHDRPQESAARPVPSDPEALRRGIDSWSTDLKRREVETAVHRLEASGDLSDRQERIVEEMADRIVAELIDGPTAAIEDGERNGDDTELAALARLFGPAVDRNGEQ